MVLPGVVSIDTIDYHHKNLSAPARGAGRVDDNDFRLDIEEAARLAGLHFKVDLLNNKREVVGVFAGDFVAEHRATAQAARGLLHRVVPGADVVVATPIPTSASSCAPPGRCPPR